ncbi:MAG: DUF4157 domain-containing protein [Dehalobacter sp.]|nr:DUF4157 domain-containing protein [Dehalobacter sp.]
MAEKAGVHAKAQESKQKYSNFFKRKPRFNYSDSPADRILYFQQTAGNQAVQRLIKSRALQAKLTMSQPGDIYEQEADRIAEHIMRTPDPVLQRKCPKCDGDEKKVLQAKNSSGKVPAVLNQNVHPLVNEVLHSPGQPLNSATRAFMEPRFGYDFSNVRVHTDVKAAESARAMNARAYTMGRDIVFGMEQSAPSTSKEKMLMAHELAHVIQQGETNSYRKNSLALSPIGQLNIQRTLGDGHDLTSPRFSRLPDLEATFDGEKVIIEGNSSRGVQAIQHALYDLGFPLPKYGADGVFGSETKDAVKDFQRANPPLVDDGKVGKLTMSALDTRFGAPTLPPRTSLSEPWTAACVRSVLCPWSPHTIDVLRTKITLKSFDFISFADEYWNGRNWIPSPVPVKGYRDGSEIGIKNSSCEDVSKFLYHEVLHTEQPSTHKTTKQRESYVYRITEEFNIAMGLTGRPELRSTDVQGREYADPTKVETFVGTYYPSVPKGGGGGDQIIDKASTYGHVNVQRPNGTIYTRPAVTGEKVPGRKITIPVKEVIHPTAGWICP